MNEAHVQALHYPVWSEGGSLHTSNREALLHNTTYIPVHKVTDWPYWINSVSGLIYLQAPLIPRDWDRDAMSKPVTVRAVKTKRLWSQWKLRALSSVKKLIHASQPRFLTEI